MTTQGEFVERLRERARIAREENTGTALGDALHFEEAAAEIDRLRATPPGSSLEREDGTIASVPPASSISTQVAEQVWRPIESAPRDGTPVLGICCEWWEPVNGNHRLVYSAIVHTWWNGNRFEMGQWKQPTHWMSPPSLPSKDSPHTEEQGNCDAGNSPPPQVQQSARGSEG